MAFLRLVGGQFVHELEVPLLRRVRRPPAAASGLVVVIASTIAIAVVFAVARSQAPPLPRPPAARQHQARIPAALQQAVSATIGSASAAYRVQHSGAGLVAQNPAQGLSARFSANGVNVSSRGAVLGLDLRAIGSGSSLTPLPSGVLRAEGNRVSSQRGGVDEWYVNGPLGLEQGFTVLRAPNVAGSGPLTLSLAITGGLRASLAADRRSVALERAGGTVLRYDGLKVTDARGRVLPAWLSLAPGQILIHARTRGAAFPLHIDPFLQQGSNLAGSGESGEGFFGAAVAISTDGTTALVGGPGDHENVGAAWVFTRSGRTWKQQGEKLTATGETGAGEFGSSVALSSDGNTALIGGMGDASDVGAAWVFTRSAGKWSQQGGKLTGKMEKGAGHFGAAVALSSEGDTALIGALRDDSDVGAAWVFTRSGEKWSQQGKKLTGLEESGAGEVGSSVALSADGNTALLGGAEDDAERGAVWVFTLSGGEWLQQGKKLSAGGFEEIFGDAVALSADGNTALIGAEAAEAAQPHQGAAYVFTRSGSTWTQQGGKLTGGEEEGEGEFGSGVSLSSDGNTALIGGPTDEGDEGAAWIFKRSEGKWSQFGGKLTDEFEAEAPFYGVSVALSGDGSVALIGGPEAGHGHGGVWVDLDHEAPSVSSEPATEATTSAALLHGSVNPEWEGIEECVFEYGTTESYGSSVPCSPSKPGGEEGEALAVPVAARIEGLTPDTTYHFRITAANFQGQTRSHDETFSTLQAQVTGESKAPTEAAEASEAGLSVKATGGIGQVTIGRYGAEIGGPRLARSHGVYFQVYRHEGSSFTKIEYKDCELGGAKTIWWDNTANGWEPIRPPTAAYEESSHCITVTATESTTPSVAELADPRHVGGPSANQELGKCEPTKHGFYSDTLCQTEDVKGGAPKGKYEWLPDPVGCFAQKHGRFGEGACAALDEKKGAPKGKFEEGVNGFTATAGITQLEVQGAPSIKCTAATATGQDVAPNQLHPTVTYTGCEREKAKCSSAGKQAGEIEANVMESYTYEEGTEYFSVIGGRGSSPFMQFSCSGENFILTGLAAGELKAPLNKALTSDEAVFGETEGPQELQLINPEGHSYPVTLAGTLTVTQDQASELRVKGG